MKEVETTSDNITWIADGQPSTKRCKTGPGMLREMYFWLPHNKMFCRIQCRGGFIAETGESVEGGEKSGHSRQRSTGQFIT